MWEKIVEAAPIVMAVSAIVLAILNYKGGE